MKQKFFIDTHKGITAVAILVLMAIYEQWDNPTAWVYLALHGSYGYLWVLKSLIFPDATWEQKTSFGYGLVIWGGLSLYWIAPWLLVWRGNHAPSWYLAVCIGMYILGVFLHFGGDMQKYTALKYRPGQLIQDGLFTHVRNINYFGEFLIYLGFGLLAMHWAPVIILLLWVLFVWLPRMRKKDRSLARYAGFEAYKRRSRLFIPFFY
jgi:protein-S-isoprenylcysteine O-methyltransferase Ste14